MSTNKMLATEKIGPLLLRLAIPTIVAQIVNILYNMVDRIYIGNMANSSSSLAALAVCLPLITIITAFTRLVGVGGAPLCAIRLGQRKQEEAERVMTTSFVLLLICSFLITILTFIFQEKLLYLFGADIHSIEQAKSYLSIYVLGTVFAQLSIGMNAYITTQGYSKISMVTVLSGAIVNIILDPIFIFYFDMGVQGAAIATIIAQAISCTWVMLFLFSEKREVRIRKEYFIPKASVVFGIMSLGISPFTMSATESALQISFNTQLSTYGGVTALSVMAIMFSLWQFVTLPVDGFMQGAQPILSYNYGARNYQRVRETFKLALKISVLTSFTVTTLMLLFAPVITSFFSVDSATIELATWAVRIYIVGGLIYGIQMCCQSSFMALGQAKHSLAMALFRKVVVLIPMLLILPGILKDTSFALMMGSSISQYVYHGGAVFTIFLCEPISDILASLMTGSLFLTFYRKHLRHDPVIEKE